MYLSISKYITTKAIGRDIGNGSNVNQIPDGAILTEDGLNYLITEDGLFAIAYEPYPGAILTEDGSSFIITEDEQFYLQQN